MKKPPPGQAILLRAAREELLVLMQSGRTAQGKECIPELSAKAMQECSRKNYASYQSYRDEAYRRLEEELVATIPPGDGADSDEEGDKRRVKAAIENRFGSPPDAQRIFETLCTYMDELPDHSKVQKKVR